ncbi:MAG: helix-turn-helix transcriptional regulator [Prevotella sp.]|nr:helix-turn-helix transcriptional regulator [Prevotella sp.]
MKDRIKQIMESLHMSQQVFADFIGANPATLSGIFNDRTRPTLNIVEAIKKKIPDINTDWLMFGTGNMYGVASGQGAGAETPERALTTPVSNDHGHEGRLDFEAPSSSTLPNMSGSTVAHVSVRNTRTDMMRETVKFVDKPPRHVTEIRVYYDDQTWESFVPSKK